MSESEYTKLFGDFKHIFTGVNMVDFYRDLAKTDKYFSLSSLGLPSNPLVYPGLTTGSASSQIPPTGSLNAPSP